MPLSAQFPISSEHEDAKIRCSRRLAELRRHRSIEVGHREDVFPRVTRNFLRVVSRLKPPRFFINTVSHQRGRDFAPDREVLSGKTNNRNHPIVRVPQTIIRNPVAHGARLFWICGCGQHQYSHVPVRSGKFVSINVDKTDRVSCSTGKCCGEKRSRKERQDRYKEKELQCAQLHK